MRKVNFVEPDSASWRAWKTKCEKETDKISKDWRPGKKMKFKSDLYKRQKQVYFDENGPFRGKCGYCESKLQYHDDLDHFRPKAPVRTETGQNVVIEFEGEKINHPGYYWLAYSWNNLISSCKDCNSITKRDGNAIGKGNRFPVKGGWATRPGEEASEEPLLINPTIDDPEKHLKWDHKAKMILAASEKGKVTTRILGFYQREELKQQWRKAYNDFFMSFGMIIANVDSFEGEFDTLNKEIDNGQRPHSFVVKAAFAYIKEKLS